MAEIETPKPELDIIDSPPKREARKLRRRSFTIDKEKLTYWIIDTHQNELDTREKRRLRRVARREKLMGWLVPKNWPWKDASSVYLPIMQISNLKIRGVIENALKSLRPMIAAKAKQRRNNEKEEPINRVLDYQFFLENNGEALIDDFATCLVEDEAVFAMVNYVKDEQSYYDVRRLPSLDPLADPIIQILPLLPTLFPERLTERMTDNEGWEWEVVYLEDKKERRAKVAFYETEDELEAHIVKTVTAFDGPAVRILDFEDVVFPARAANLQSPSSQNPLGAPWVDIRFSVNLDTIRRRIKDRTYDQVTMDDWDDITGGKSEAGSGNETDEEKTIRDDMEGTEINFQYKREDRQGIMRFGRLDVNNDGLEEDVIVWILEDPKLLLKISILTEIFPGVPILRPITSTSFMTIPNRILGISNSELLESLQDVSQDAMDQHINWGELTNTPFFFYRASSGLKSEPIYIEPGVGNPLDDPARDVFFPTWPTKDSTYSINVITILQQYIERLQMFSDASFGRVPTGKASAYRTMGTTMSLLAQGDARSEQVLRRAFAFFSDIYEFMHRLNRNFLPDKKEVRLIGVPAQGEDAYLTVDRNALDADCDWEFKATLINTNKQTLSAALTETISMAITPMAFQLGLVDAQGAYKLLRDKTKALDLDPDNYWKRPPDPMPGPKLLAEEVLSLILANEMPQGGPLETPQEHLQKLVTFTQTDQFGFFNPTQVQILKAWIGKIQGVINQQMMQQQALMDFQKQVGGPGGPGGSPTTMAQPGIGENPQVQPGEKIDESVGVQ